MPYRLGGATLIIAAFLSCAPALATPQPAPPGGPIQQFDAHDANGSVSFAYGLWARILDTVVEEDGKGRLTVNFGGLGIQGKEALDTLIGEMTGVPVAQLNRDEQLAYWLNLYNAASLRIMLDQTSGGGQSMPSRNPYGDAQTRFNLKRIYGADGNPWTQRTITVAGTALSLNDIEHRILYAYWKPEQVMYGLWCPMRGCPALARTPFYGGQIGKQLADAARRFIADPANVTVKGTSAELSELYRMHQAAFGGEAGVLEHLRRNAGPRQAEFAPLSRISGYDFDWKLAGKMPPASARLPQGQINRGAGAGGQLQE